MKKFIINYNKILGPYYKIFINLEASILNNDYE